MLSSVYLVEYTLHQNLIIEIHTRNFDFHITVPSPNLAFLCRNLDYKPYSIIVSLLTSIYLFSLSISCCQAEEMGYHPLYLMLPAGITCSFAFMLPMATIPNAIAYATGKFQVKDMVSRREATLSLSVKIQACNFSWQLKLNKTVQLLFRFFHNNVYYYL